MSLTIELFADSVVRTASVCTAVTAIVAFVWSVLSRTKKTLDGVRSLQKHVSENYLSTLKLTIMNSEMPIEERLEAGEKYVNLGGNGAVKCKYRELQKEYEEKLRHIV